MQEVTFNLQTLTPLFLAGAEQTEAELRAPTFRGLMRYWQRALAGGITGTDALGLEQVMEAEKSVFGSTNTGSAVSVRITTTSIQSKEFTEQISERIEGKWQATGKGYLLWSMARSGRADRGNVKPARWYFPPGTSFEVTLTSRGQDTADLKQAIASFWLLTHLGGIGSRSRRCAGSLKATVVDEKTFNSLDISDLSFSEVKTAQDLKLQIEKGIQTARMLCKLTPRLVKEARFDILAPGMCRIWILQDEQTWQDAEMAMRVLGERLQDYRSLVPIGRRKIFGLPLMPLIRDKRRASPLLLRVAELQGNRYVGIAVLFKTISSDVQIGDYTVIEQWINKFRGKVEVQL